MVILQFIEIIGRTFLAVFEALFSLFPVFQELSDLKDVIIAAAIGVPVAVISIVGTSSTVIKFLAKHA